MSIDVFGHGIEAPLPASGAYHHGSDRLNGPHRCRGGTKPCVGNTSDHQCCCDVCRHASYFTCEVGCCKCLPVAICAVFTPDTPAGACKVRSWKMIPSKPETIEPRVLYSATVGGSTLTLSAGTPVLGSPLHGTAECTWRMQYGETDEEVEITHLDGQVNCLRLPEFSIEVDIPVNEVSCPGTITFAQFVYEKVPYVNRWHGASIEAPLDTACGLCTDACTVLAIKRGDESDYGYSSGVECEEFIWDATEQAWIKDSERIEFFEVEGVCYLKLVAWATATLQGDLIALEHCTLGLVRTLRDELGNWVQISCNPCSCWEHICGTCRCLCEKMCVIGIDDGVLTGPWELDWDSELLQWWDSGDETAPVIAIGKSEAGNCQITHGDYDPIAIDNTCGNNISFVFTNDAEDQETNGIQVLAGWCKQCVGSCDNGTCLSDCDEVPKELYATVYPLDWTPMLGCEGFPATDCFEQFVIPMVQLFVPSVLNPAGEWRWIGATTFQCRGCDTGGNPDHATYRTTVATIDIGCDGLGSLSVTGVNSSGASRTETVDINFTLPCGTYADWSFLGPWEETNAGDMLCCDNGAGFGISISDTAPP